MLGQRRFWLYLKIHCDADLTPAEWRNIDRQRGARSRDLINLP